MAITVATHNGPFHADDVMAVAMIRNFVDSEAAVVRTRDSDTIKAADWVVDVGAKYDPETHRFDHHQQSYQGPLSSAGMVLNHLGQTGVLVPRLAQYLRDELMDYIDDVDNGRVAPRAGVPCFAKIVEALNQPAAADASFDIAFEGAVGVARSMLDGLVATFEREQVALAAVKEAMEAAAREGRSALFLDQYYRWKRAYFELGGADHPTAYVLFPGTDDSWRIVAIPPKLGDFGQKRPLPEAWAGLTGTKLTEVVGVPGARFCHKNRFIAVFDTREGAVEALHKHGLMAPLA